MPPASAPDRDDLHFIAGTIPLILGHGAGAEVRGVTGDHGVLGMLGVTLFGLFLTPVFT